MNRLWIKQVFNFISQIFWIDESNFSISCAPNYRYKDGWIISLFPYKQKTIKDAIWQMKFRSNKNMACYFGKYLEKAITDYELENYILVSIPIHWRRRMERGFNQTEWLCQEIIKINPKIKWCKVLKRTIYSAKQSWNNKKDRQENIKSVFTIKHKFKNKIDGQNFLIIDDVVTTGATLKEACRELRESGALNVKALTVAH